MEKVKFVTCEKHVAARVMRPTWHTEEKYNWICREVAKRGISFV
jgi:hypothetical protein